MAQPGRPHLLRHGGSPLGRRLVLLFLAAAILPLAVSSWVSASLQTRWAEQRALERAEKSTKQVSRQVYERLLGIRAVLASLPPAMPVPGLSGAPPTPPGLGRVFLSLSVLDGAGAVAWSTAGAGAIPATVKQAPRHQRVAPGEDAVALIGTPGERGGDARLWMVRFEQAQPRWIAEVVGAHVWAPVIDTDADSAWTVRDRSGLVLLRQRGEDYPTTWPVPGEGPPPDAALDAHIPPLYLDGSFASSDWEFLRRAPREAVTLSDNRSLAGWLGGVALATLLLVAWLSNWQIRRMLAPLQQLTDGTRRLAAGAAEARVEIRRDDEIGALAASFNDMASRLQARGNELEHRATHDSLTGLANRYGLHRHLERQLGNDQPLAVLFVDLDHFKDVNDSRGHAAGDALLCQAAERLRAVAGPGDLVARPGGDEFAVVIDLVDGAGEAAAVVAAQAIAALSRPFVLAEGEHTLGASIGIALAPMHGRNRDELMRRADVALYDAKAHGRGRQRMFTADLDHLARDRIALVAALRQALARRELVVHYQPRIDPRNGRIRSAEALVRWQHPERGLLFPGSFIGAAESSGLIDALGLEVLSLVCEQLARWRDTGLPIERVSVNVSPQQLDGGRLPQQVRELLERHGIPPAQLELEVTESLLAGDQRSAHAQLAEMRSWGLTIALDDFGTGYSSMSTLHQLPIDVMKVDRAFVTHVCTDANARAITSAVIALARAMDLHLVAEGIEDEAQARLLQRLGCDELQGFLYSRAVPAEDFATLPGLYADAAVA